jgi:hypothetical protein
LVQDGQLIHESVFEMDNEYEPTAELYGKNEWVIEKLDEKGILEKDLYASARGVMQELEKRKKEGRCELKVGELDVLEVLSSHGKFVRYLID